MNTYGCAAPDKRLPEGVDRLMIMCGATYNDATWADFGDAALSNNSVGTGVANAMVVRGCVGAWVGGRSHLAFF